ncbi:MAG TPA: hypothetical protein VFQ15_03570 [Jiangellaceae bacterium]|nr:hypothetical protein [Jiangellaceae bacterium]
MDWDEFLALLPEPHTVTVEAYTGSGAYGDTFAAPVEIDRCFVDAKRKRVRIQTQDAAGAEVVSSTQVYCPPDTVAPPGSRVTLPSGAVSKVLDAAALTDAGLDLPEHVALSLE